MEATTLPVPLDVARQIAKGAAVRMYGRLRGQVPFEDLEAEAWVGLLRCVPRFDESRSKFETYAGTKSYFHLLDWIRDQSFLPRLEQVKVRAGLAQAPQFRSLSTVLAEDNRPQMLGETIGADDASLRQVDDADQVEWILSTLKPMDAAIARFYFLGGLTMRATAEEVGLSESRISQRVCKLVARLRERFGVA